MGILIIGVVAIAGWFVTRQFVVPSLSPRPDNLGVTDGKLTACPDFGQLTNCVNSQADTSDRKHYVAPLPYLANKTTTYQRVLTIVTDMGGEIITQDEDYIHAEFRSSAMQFVDDVELYFDSSANAVHVRSAARLGKGDMGVNRKRVEAIRERLIR